MSAEVASARYTFGEELANSLTHGLGVVLSVIGVGVLLNAPALAGSASAIAACAVYGATLIALYTTSTLYHCATSTKAKRVLRILDHLGIFLLIAGTYTPFTLGVLRGDWGWALFGLVWGLAVVGIVFKALGGVHDTPLSTWLYLALGWVVVVAAKAVWTLVPGWGLFWLIAGGIAYTAGAVFFMAERVRYFHFVWHLFVVAGTACHFIAVLRYAA